MGLLWAIFSVCWAADVEVFFTQLPDGAKIEVPLNGGFVDVRGPHRERWRVAAELVPGTPPGQVRVALDYELVHLGRHGPHRGLLPAPHKRFEAVLDVPPSSSAEYFSGGEIPRAGGGFTDYGVRFLVERLDK